MGKRYKTVVIDFPWPIKADKIPNTLHRKSGRWNEEEVKLDYTTPNLDCIRSFPINDFADEECLLFLWVTNGKIDEIPILKIGLDLFNEWKFKYHQIITWVKETGLCVWSPIRSVTEHILLGYRGTLPKTYAVMNSAFRTPQAKIHSTKPAKFYQLLRAWTPKPRIDIFARNAHEGFDGWGNEYVGEGTLAQYLEE